MAAEPLWLLSTPRLEVSEEHGLVKLLSPHLNYGDECIYQSYELSEASLLVGTVPHSVWCSAVTIV